MAVTLALINFSTMFGQCLITNRLEGGGLAVALALINFSTMFGQCLTTNRFEGGGVALGSDFSTD